ncbi:LicD family protein [Gemmatimonadota bacterium]
MVFEPMDPTTAEALLKEAKQLLDGLGLVFFLRHGTCLGAVREKAFIEWDDDLDIGSVIGLHGLSEELVRGAAGVFEEHGFDTVMAENELHQSVSLKKSGIQMDWTCYRIIDGNIFQWPVVPIPVSLHTNLKEIDFLGERFLVPNPPEEYLGLKYGPEWMIPKRAGGFEKEVLDLMAETTFSTPAGGIMGLANELETQRHTGRLKVLDLEGRPVEGAEVSFAATTVLTGLDGSRTNSDGYVYFSLPVEAGYVVGVQYGDHEEILYSEHLAPGVNYVYRPDPESPAGRTDALIAEGV